MMSRDQALATTLGELRACWLGVRCVGCTRLVYLPLQRTALKVGARRQLGALLDHLRCDHCSSPPVAAWLVDYPIEDSTHGGRCATWRIDLVP